MSTSRGLNLPDHYLLAGMQNFFSGTAQFLKAEREKCPHEIRILWASLTAGYGHCWGLLKWQMGHFTSTDPGHVAHPLRFL